MAVVKRALFSLAYCFMLSTTVWITETYSYNYAKDTDSLTDK